MELGFMRKKWMMFAMFTILLLLLAACGPRDYSSQGGDSTQGSAPTEQNGNQNQNQNQNNATEDVNDAVEEEEAAELDTTDLPIVTIEMEDGGIIEAALFPEIAPNTVNNFISLVQSGFYDGTIYHRVIPGFMIQGGDPDGTGMGGPGYAIKGEFTSAGFENGLIHERGVLSMARSGAPDSAGSQFFIMVADSPHLDGEYASFGQVISGMDVVDAIVNVPTGAQNRPTAPPKMSKVTVDTKGIEYPEPEKAN